jgi:hypothetical protein
MRVAPCLPAWITRLLGRHDDAARGRRGTPAGARSAPASVTPRAERAREDARRWLVMREAEFARRLRQRSRAEGALVEVE